MSAWGEEFAAAVKRSYAWQDRRPQDAGTPRVPAPPSREMHRYVDWRMVTLATIRDELLDPPRGWRGWLRRLSGEAVQAKWMAQQLDYVLAAIEDVDMERALKTRAVVDAYDPPQPRETSVRPKRWGEGDMPE